MSEQRSAAEIRAYCEELEENLIASKGKREAAIASYVSWGINAREDMLRLLDAVVKLREARLQYLFVYWYAEQGLDYTEAETRVRQDKLLAETAWLADSPEAELSADGENEEESET